MSLGTNSADAKYVRDVNGDYIKAYLVEYEKFVRSDQPERAEAVARELRALGHEVKAAKAPVKETAVDPEPLEKAVEQNEPPKRRPRKTAE